jgi:molybdopterin molybdotransferase
MTHATKDHASNDRPHRHRYDADMLSVEEARERILSHFTVLAAEETPLLDALGQVLAEDLTAPFDIPPLPNSAMDGYAVRSVDVSGATESKPVVLPVTGAVAAGQLPDSPLKPGTAVRIMTGAPLPTGADSVVPFEDTDEQERRRSAAGPAAGLIGLKLSTEAGDNMRPAGEDVQKGALVLGKGAVLRPGELGVAASLGRVTVRVIRRPAVAIISTGDELL